MNKLLANIMKRMKYKSTKKSTKSTKKEEKYKKYKKKRNSTKLGLFVMAKTGMSKMIKYSTFIKGNCC